MSGTKFEIPGGIGKVPDLDIVGEPSPPSEKPNRDIKKIDTPWPTGTATEGRNVPDGDPTEQQDDNSDEPIQR